MSSEIVLFPLDKWTQNHITAIIQATTASEFTSAIDAFLSKDVKITVNGVCVSRADFGKKLQAEKFDQAAATVQFLGTVAVPTDPKNPVEAGSVGVFYTATIQEGIIVRDAPVSSTLTGSVNVVIEQDPDIPVPPPSPIGIPDRRRVKVLNQVFSDVRVPFNV